MRRESFWHRMLRGLGLRDEREATRAAPAASPGGKDMSGAVGAKSGGTTRAAAAKQAPRKSGPAKAKPKGAKSKPAKRSKSGAKSGGRAGK